MTGTPERRTTMGLTSDSFQSIRFASPQRLLEVDRLMALAAGVGAAGAHGGMTHIDMEWAKRTRQLKEELGMYVEVQTFLPREDPAVFEHAVRVAKEAGATSLRAVCLLGRRYEMFERSMAGSRRSPASTSRLPSPIPIVEKYRMPLGHREPQGLARRSAGRAAASSTDSEYLGVTLDTGNNLTVLDDPMEVGREAGAVHLQRPLQGHGGTRGSEHGFLLSEVPLGEGMLDMKRMVATIRRARPEVYFSLEMITRDPLEVPCLDRQVLGDVRRRQRRAPGAVAEAHPRAQAGVAAAHLRPDPGGALRARNGVRRSLDRLRVS